MKIGKVENFMPQKKTINLPLHFLLREFSYSISRLITKNPPKDLCNENFGGAKKGGRGGKFEGSRSFWTQKMNLYNWCNFHAFIPKCTIKVVWTCTIMNSALSIVDRWCVENGLTVNPTKTKLVPFTNKRKLQKLNLPKLNGTRLRLDNQAKFLDVILDKKLSWNQHVGERIRKASNIYWQCRCAFGKKWGLIPRVIHWLYVAIIRPILFYGSHVWYNKLTTKKVKSDIEHVQRMFLLGITVVMKSTPTKPM